MSDASPERSAAGSYEDVWGRSEDGLRLHARLYGRIGGATLPVLCLPGLTRNASEFHGLSLALLASGVTEAVLAVDYRGRGLSDRDPDPSRYAVPVEAADLLRLAASLGIGPAILVGVSRGGIIGMALGATRPDLVRALVLVDIGPVIERAGLLRIKGYVGRLGDPADLDAGAAILRGLFGGQFPDLSANEWRDWAETVWTVADGRLAATYDPALARMLDAVTPDAPIPDLWAAFDALAPMPVMAIRGGLSDLLSAATVAEMERRHPGLVTLHVPNEGHTPLLHRLELAAAIGRFIRDAQPRPT